MRDILSLAATSVYNQLGYGLSESSYRSALAHELKTSPHISTLDEEYGIPLFFTSSDGRSHQITILRADIVMRKNNNRLVVIELKTVSKELNINSKEYIQVSRYADLLQANEKYLINFGKEGIQIV